MTAARVRLVAAAVLFVGWLGYLGYLALGHSRPVVVSRSQALAATHVVKGEVVLDPAGKPQAAVKVLESFGPHKVADETITVENLADARLPGGKPITAPGAYLLPLKQTAAGRFDVAPSPTGQGLESSAKVHLIYPWGEEAERQLRERLPHE